MLEVRKGVRDFLFPADSGHWLRMLRIGLGLQVILYTWSLRRDWINLFLSSGMDPSIRTLTEAILSAQTEWTPRLGWLIAIGERLAGTERIVLSLVWFCLIGAGCCLLFGLFSRAAAVVAWVLYLSCVKSGGLYAYGVDNFTTIGLFYLMIAPLPDRWALDWTLRSHQINPIRLGFHRRVLQLHLCVIYFFGGISKALGKDWWNGTSVWRALTRPPFDLIPPEVLIRFEYVLPAIGILVCLLETSYPVFIWIQRTRVPWLVGILLMHVLIGLTMGLYLFALIMIVLNLSAFGPELLPKKKNALHSCHQGSDIVAKGPVEESA